MPFMARYDPFSPTLEQHPLLNSSPDFTSRNGSVRNGFPPGLPIGGLSQHSTFPMQTTLRERHKRIKQQEYERNQLIDVRLL
jgi:hypothetical protein